MNTEKFMSFVDEAKMVEREQPVKPPDYSKVEFEESMHKESLFLWLVFTIDSEKMFIL
jgi:hypothetical protein